MMIQATNAKPSIFGNFGHRSATFAAILLLAALVSACANKAKVIQTGAAQFNNEAQLAIDKIDELRRREVSLSPIGDAEAENVAVDLLMKSSRPIDQDTLEFLRKPGDLGPLSSEAGWLKFLAKLRSQYRAFAAVFSNLDKGSLFAGAPVEEAVGVLDPLVGQMAAFAKSMSEHPVTFVSERADLADQMEGVRESDAKDGVKRERFAELHRRLVAMADEENRLNEEATAQALKTARLGMELRGLLSEYNTLSVDDIAEGITKAFELADDIPGLDLAELQGETMVLLDQVNEDPGLKSALDDGFRTISTARQ